MMAYIVLSFAGRYVTTLLTFASGKRITRSLSLTYFPESERRNDRTRRYGADETGRVDQPPADAEGTWHRRAGGVHRKVDGWSSVETSLDDLATGIPKKGDLFPDGSLFLDDASHCSMSFVFIIPVAPF